MNTTVRQIHIADDLEAGSALALLFAAAGYEVETDFCDGSVFILTEDVDPELDLPANPPQVNALARQLQQRMDDLAEEAERHELSSEFHRVA
jgi:hypothetical protein